MYSAEQSGEGTARPTGLTETVHRAEAGGGAARSAARTRPPPEPTRHGRGACRLTGSGRSVGRKHEKEKPQGGGERGPRPRRSPGLALGSTGAAPHARLALDLQDGGAGDASCREIPAAQAIVTRRAETRRTFDHSRGPGAGSERQGRGLLARREKGRARFGVQAGAAGRSLERGHSGREVQGESPRPDGARDAPLIA